MRAELVVPEKLSVISTDELAQLLAAASRGRFGQQKASALKQSAHTTFATEYASEAYSLCLSVLAESYQHTQKVTLVALRAKIQECLKHLDFKHRLDTIPYFGDLVIGTFLSELGDPRWFLTVDAVVAWFGLDPSVSRSADKSTGKSHITKRGTKIGRRMMWITARNFAHHTSIGKAYFQKLTSKGLSYDAAIVKIAAKLVRIAFSMLKSGKAYDEKLAFPSAP